jgi:hypothetical protein
MEFGSSMNGSGSINGIPVDLEAIVLWIYENIQVEINLLCPQCNFNLTNPFTN